ncbi:hypothetical protein CSA37_01605 [Candidatus Fermentibacteria bacterium]|nr:MAG: hypothetical protein CSA37_13525 [Candidatus Fermentibacteria bacterium]PIE53379.1 MAG: hypothetical protein CSA37_01605 [Candidatus Fermentibacteria bacterium]
MPFTDPAAGRPLITTTLHNLSNLYVIFSNIGIVGTRNSDLTMEWPGGSLSNHLWFGSWWGSAFGQVTPSGAEGIYVSRVVLGSNEDEFRPSEGYPMQKILYGDTAHEQTEWAEDDWWETNDNPMGLQFHQKAYSWSTPGYNQFMANHIRAVHNSLHGNPGVPLNGFCFSVQGDCDIASADPSKDFYIDDMVFYDGHIIWCNDPNASFEYIFDSGERASNSDRFIYRRNQDASWADPEDEVYYHYNYSGSDGIVDADVNSDGVSDHFTILFKVSGSDTVFTTEPCTGLELFSDGRPENYWLHSVEDTVYAVVPRNMSYMWDGDRPETYTDDTGEPTCNPPCTGFLGWRLMDFWIVKANGDIQRPIDVMGYPVPLSHSWWDWENDAAATDTMAYDVIWGRNMDYCGRRSGPAYLANWTGDDSAPLAFQPSNPGPFPVVHDNPLSLGYLPFDYRFLLSAGPVNLADGDTLHIVGGWVIGKGLEELRRNADIMLDAYYRDGGWGVPDVPPVPSFYYEAGDDQVQMVWNDNGEWYEPFGGYRLYRSVFNTTSWELAAEMNRGVYSFTDTTVTRGYPYYYALCVYDGETGVESPLENYKKDLNGNPLPVVPGWSCDPDWTENVKAVPNPYKISASWEGEHNSMIAFVNLPPMCDIRVYTLAGDHVRTLEHRSYGGNSGVEYWNLANNSGSSVCTGLYVYTVQTETAHFIGRLAIVR